MLRRRMLVLLSLCLVLLCFGCQGTGKSAGWTATSLRNEDDYFTVPGAQPRPTIEELEKLFGYELEPMEPIPAYSLAETRRYVPANTDRASMEVEFYGGKAVPGFIFDLVETNGEPDRLNSISLMFREKYAAKVAEKFLADAESLWGEPTEIRTGESVISKNGKQEPTETLMRLWRVDSDEYITLLSAGTITHNGEIITFMLEWGTYNAADYQ